MIKQSKKNFKVYSLELTKEGKQQILIGKNDIQV